MTVDVIIIGGGPCGMSAAIECENKGLSTLIIEKGNVVNSIYNYPTHQTFFSSQRKSARNVWMPSYITERLLN